MWWPWGFAVVFGFFLVFVLLRILLLRRWGRGWGCGWGYARPYGRFGPQDATEILRERLARGEISDAEYRRLRDTIRT